MEGLVLSGICKSFLDLERESGQNSGAMLQPVGGNTSEPPDASDCPGKSSLFFLTIAYTLEKVHPEKGLANW